jgi:hypothetical protein
VHGDARVAEVVAWPFAREDWTGWSPVIYSFDETNEKGEGGVGQVS